MSKIKQIDFTGKFTSLDGTPIKNEFGKPLEDIYIFLGNKLAMIQSDEPMRNLEIAREIFTKKVISLKQADKDFLIKQLEKLMLPDLMLLQLKERIEK